MLQPFKMHRIEYYSQDQPRSQQIYQQDQPRSQQIYQQDQPRKRQDRVENVFMIRQEIEAMRRDLYNAVADKNDLEEKFAIFQQCMTERNDFIGSQLMDILNMLEYQIEFIVMRTTCFLIRRNRLRRKLQVLCRIRSQLKQIQMTIFPLDHQASMTKDNARLDKQIKSYFV